MRHFPRAIALTSISAPMFLGGCGGAETGVAATANTASKASSEVLKASATVVQTTKYVVNNIPQVVYELASAMLRQNNWNWGSPTQIVVTDTTYVLFYETPNADRIRNGTAKMVVIARNATTDPTQPY